MNTYQWHRLLSGAGAGDRPIALEWPPRSESRWPLKRLKYVSRQITDQCVTQADDERYVALEHVESWTGSLSAPAGPVAFASKVKRFAQDDILFGKLRPYLAKVVRPSFKGVCVSEFIVLRARTDVIEPAFLEAVLRSKALIDLVAAAAAGAKMPRTEWSVVGNLPIPVPPLNEQRQILASWSVLQKQSLALAEQAKRDIDLAIEYRTRLIADVVTGQHDMRSWRPEPDDATADAEASAAWGLLGGGAADEPDDDLSLQGASGDDEPDGHE